MLFATPVDARLLDGRFYDQAGAEYYTSPEKLAGDFAPQRFARELAWFRRYCQRGRVLDVGCNTGAFLHQLLRAFPGEYAVLGLDVSGPALDHARSLGLPVRAEALVALEPGEEPFDAITFWAVLEHVDSPLAFLRAAAALLTSGGCAFVLVPNARSLAMRVLGARYRYLMPEHINCFSAVTLRLLVAAVPELEVVELQSTHFNPVVLWQDAWRARDEVPAAERARLMARTNAWKSNRRLGWLRQGYAAVEGMLGRLGLADNLMLVLRRRR